MVSGLRPKLIGLITLPALVLAILLYVSTVATISGTWREHRLADSAAAAIQLSKGFSEQRPVEIDAPKLEGAMREVTDAGNGVRYVCVIGKDDIGDLSVLASTRQEYLGRSADQAHRTVLRSGVPDWMRSGGLLVTRVPVKVSNQVVAVAEIGFDVNPVIDAANAVRMRFIIIATAAGLALMTLAYGIADRQLLSRLGHLEKAADGVSAGDLSQVDVVGNDEISRLADRFNRMIGALAQRDLENINLQEKLSLRYREARAEAITDGLTLLHNHRYFQERLDEELARVARSGEMLSIAFCDVDGFKGYNDRLGHQQGDVALKRIAETIRSSVRNIDITSRYGGEEFALIFPGIKGEDAVVVGERIRSEVQESFQDADIPLTISVGIASHPADGRKKAELLQKADWAMYQAKKMGKNRVLYSPGEIGLLTGSLLGSSSNSKS